MKNTEFDVFLWANEIDEVKNNVSAELFLFNKNYTPYKIKYSDKLTGAVKSMFMQEAVHYIIEEADKGLECREYEKADGEEKVIYKTSLSKVGRAETLIHLIPDSVVALTFVALGTSLPELVTAITSLAKGHGALSLGNVIGANLFNLVLVSGVSVVISPFAVPAEKTIAGINSSLIVDMPVMWIVMLLLTVPALIRGKLSRAQGILLLVIYFAFTVGQFLI